MPEVKFPYGKEFLSLDIPEDRYAGTLVSDMHHYVAPKSPAELVNDAMANPIGTPRLSVMAEGKKKVVLIASDHTRPVPSKDIVPQMLAEIRQGNPEADITILISTGCHRGTTKEELISKFGPEIVANEKIVVHDCDDTANLTYIGKLPSGGDLIINKVAAEADLLVAEGFIEPHFFAGFSGGRKSILPGIASRKTVVYNHNGQFIADPHARTGIVDGNPIHNDMLYAARAARLAYVVNVVINAEKNAIFAVAGDVDLAHRVGREFLASQCQVKAVPSEIVISTNGGYPLDQNIYQSVKGMTAAEATVKEGGVIIMLSKCNDGHGGKVFHETFRDEKNLERMMKKFIETPPDETIIDQWQSQIFARLLMKATVVFVSDADDELVSDLHMVPAHSMEEALQKADEILAAKGITGGKILAIPDGVSVLRLKLQRSGAGTEHHTPQLSPGVLQGEVKVTGGILPLEIGDLSLHGNGRENRIPERYPIEDVWNGNEYDDLNSIAIVSFSGETVSKMLDKDDEVKGQKSEKLIERIVNAHTQKGDLVLDFFGGAGTTAAVCMKMQRQFIVCEQLDKHLDIMERRLTKVIQGEQSGISRRNGWSGGGLFVSCELAQCNAVFAEEIAKAADDAALTALLWKILDTGYASHRVWTADVRGQGVHAVVLRGVGHGVPLRADRNAEGPCAGRMARAAARGRGKPVRVASAARLPDCGAAELRHVFRERTTPAEAGAGALPHGDG